MILDSIEIIFQYGLGIQLLYWGLNGLFQWTPVRPAHPGIEAFVSACLQARFIMPTVKFLEVIIGVLLLGNYAVPLALVLFAPLLFVIMGLHFQYTPNPWPIFFLYVVPFGFIAFQQRDVLLRLIH